MSLDLFSGPVRDWFEQAFEAPTAVQRLGWPRIAGGQHVLMTAPTGSGKTLAAFLWAIEGLLHLPPDAPPGVRVVYVSPLKALVYDIERNLRTPLAGIRAAATRHGEAPHTIRVDVRTGDTPQRLRRKQARDPAEILVTTPESLYLILGSAARETLRTATVVIVDEIHAMAPTKRGTHLVLTLERLAAVAHADPQRVGLSATIRPLELVARFLGGDRPVEVVDAGEPPHLDLRIAVPVPDMTRPPPAAPGEAVSEPGSIWPALYPAILDLVHAHRTTIVFVNARATSERLTRRLNELAGADLFRAHHGSLSHDRRAEVEEALEQGRIRGIVATSSLELGIDMGTVDLVVLVESPGTAARGLQRVGRAGHQVGEPSTGVLIPKFRGDLLECAVVAGRMASGELEAIAIPRNALDVLAQQVVAMVAVHDRGIAELGALVRRAFPYAELSPEALHDVLDMLSGRWTGDAFADVRPRVAWDRARDVLRARRGARMLALLNGGTIPDRGLFPVQVGHGGPRVGELEEEMVFESRPGETILLGASTWRVEQISPERVVVSPAPGESGKMPFWRGSGPGRPIEMGRAIGAFLRHLGEFDPTEAREWLLEHTPVEPMAADNLVAYLDEQQRATGALPTDRAVTVERFRDELGDWRVCVLTPFGSRVHTPWVLCLQALLSARAGYQVQAISGDDGIALRFADVEELPTVDLLFPDPDEVEDLVVESLGGSALFGARFRENAARALLLPRNRPGRRTPLWQQRLRARHLLAAVRQVPSFPIVLETYRECLQDVFDVEALVQLLRDIRSRQVRVDPVTTSTPSPFARSLVFAYTAEFLYDYDNPLAERRAQALSLDRGLLRELLGGAELRELLDAEVLVAVEAELQGLAEGRRARDADEVHDLLLRVGSLGAAEVAARSTADPEGWLEALRSQLRAVELEMAGAIRWVAAEDVARHRDALGASPPADLPASLLGPTSAPVEGLLLQYARTHGPFTTSEVAARLGLLPAQAEPILTLLMERGVLVRGALRPGGDEPEWCDPGVLRRLRRRTLARLRTELAPVDGAALARFLPAWQGLDHPGRLEEAVQHLEGVPLPWSDLSTAILPTRVTGFRPEMLDLLGATGAVVWVGRGGLGPSDGRVALYRRAQVGRFLDEPVLEDAGPLHRRLLEHLESRGACFTAELLALGAADEVRAALWDLVWAGVVTNDTFQPLRALGTRALAGGRWSLVSELITQPVTAEQRALARAEALLGRYGVVSREVALAEELTGGFAAVYPVLRAMEEAGRVQRGWFVEGFASVQFAAPGAVNRLRTGPGDQPGVRVLAAVDPACPWGGLLPWPRTGSEAQPRRESGARVVLVDGLPVLYLGRGEHSAITFPAFADRRSAGLALDALRRLPGRSRYRSLHLERIDGASAQSSPLAPRFTEAGFVADHRGLVLPGRS